MKIIVKKIQKINKKNLKIKFVISEISKKSFWKISFKIDKNEWKYYHLRKFNLIFKKWMKIIVEKSQKSTKTYL